MKNLTIVMYHYVRQIKKSAFPNLKGLEIEDFHRQIDFFRKNYNFITIEDLIYFYCKKKSLPENAILLTFDDGYSDHYLNVVPILNSFNIKGAFYCTVSTIMKNKVLDVNKIHFILEKTNYETKDIIKFIQLKINNLSKDKKSYDFEFYYKKYAKKGRYDNKDVMFLKRFLQDGLDNELRVKILNELFIKYAQVSEKELSEKLYMNQNHIKELHQSGHHIGCHGYDHLRWNNLQDKELDFELKQWLKFSKELNIYKDFWTACYPYGANSQGVIKKLRNLGCSLAFSTDVSTVDLIHHDPMNLPRMNTNDFIQ